MTRKPATPDPTGDGLSLPPAELLISDPEQLKALGDPLRIQILEALGSRPRHGWTAKELARVIDIGQTRLYHHLNLLDERGLIRVVGTRVVSGIVERRYQAAARGFHLDRSLSSGADAAAGIGQVLEAALTETRRQIMASIDAGRIDPAAETPGHRLFLLTDRLRMRPDRVERFIARLQELLADEDAGDAADAEEQGLLIAFYPMTGGEKRRR